MTALHEQRRQLVEDNASLIHQWLALLPKDSQLSVLRSLVDGYSLPNLRKMNAHVRFQVTLAQDGGDDARH